MIISIDEYNKLPSEKQRVWLNDRYVCDHIDEIEEYLDGEPMPETVELMERATLPTAEQLFESIVEDINNGDIAMCADNDYDAANDLDKKSFIAAITPWLEEQQLNFFITNGTEVQLVEVKQS